MRVPELASDPLRLEAGGAELSVTWTGAPDVPLQAREGRWRARAGGVELELVPIAGGVEDWIRLPARPARAPSYELGLRGVAGLRRVGGTLELLDARGTPLLRAGPAYLIDARGERREVGLALEGCRADESPLPPWGRAVTPPGADRCELTLAYDDRGLSYPIAIDPPWASSTTMAVGRARPSAVKLSDGRVLVVSGAASAVAELYDPATRTWASTGSMASARSAAAAALLPSGKVLVSGGFSGSTPLSSAELWDPATGSFTPTGVMKAARAQHTATTLGSGKVLVAGGATAGFNPTAAADLYDPASGTFSSTGAMAQARAKHTATLLADGRVLAVGDWDAPGAELYSPSTGLWTSGGSGTQLEDHTATLLGDGRVLFAGGRTGGGLSTTNGALLFDPNGNTWNATSSLPGSVSKRRGHGAARLSNGRVVLVGGVCDDACATLLGYYEHKDGLFFDPTGPAWTKTSGEMAVARQEPSAIGLDSGNVLVIGGSSFEKTSEELCLAQGCACSVAAECYTGFCVDGVCCDSACTGTCRACTKALKNQGADGSCGDIAADNDPQSECAASPASSCGLDGMCDGKGGCRKHVAGTVCAASSCIDATSEVHADTCDGNGNCVDTGQGACQAGYLCKADACKTACDDKTDCAAGYECLAGACSLRPNGAPCGAGGECQSGHCVGGFCCDAACDGQCEACTQAGKVGACTPISGDPASFAKASCAGGEGPCGSSCDGKNPKACVFPGEETACGEAGKACDGAGKCLQKGAQCSADGLTSIAVDQTQTACAPYRCDASSGLCKKDCTVTADCQLGHYCEGKSCVKKSGGAASDDGGCSASGRRTRGGAGAIALLALAALALRRRRALALALGGAAALGCSAPARDETPSPAPAPGVASSGWSAPAAALRSRFGPAAPTRGPAARFVAEGSHFRPVIAGDDPTRAGAARVLLPAHADGALSVEDRASGLALEVGLEGAERAPVSFADGLAVYRGAERDVVLRADSWGVEDFVAIAARPAAPELGYRLKLRGVAGLRLVERSLELLDASGSPRLRVDPPWVIDAAGERHPAELGVEGCAVDTSPAAPFDRPVTAPGAESCRVVVKWADDLAYPLLVDPTWTTTAGHGGDLDHASAVLSNGTVLLASGGSSYLWNGTWATSGAMKAMRFDATATLLGDGRVLVTGGGAASAEIYDPTSGTWAFTGSMSVSRQRHRAVRLSDGSVLVTGGDASGSTERWVNGSFSSAGSLGKNRLGHTATLLADGRVLVVGGVDNVANDLSTRIFSLGSGWSAGPSSKSLRQNHVAARLGDGRVLVAGGEDIPNAPGAIADVELYDPSTNAFTVGQPMPAPMRMSVAVPFGLGSKVYVIGGRGGGAGGAASTWVFDVLGGSWSDGGTLQRTRFRHTAELRPNGQLLVIGGYDGAETLPPSEYQCVDYGCACSTSTPCLVGSCVDGVCCKTACSGACQACSAAKKGSGQNGDCGPVADGSDPDDDCALQAASSCGTIGTCNGAGACRLYAAGTECAGASCSTPTVSTPASSCDGNGACVAAAPVSCDPGYACVGTSCKTSCTSASDCQSGWVCKSGQCKKKANGEACSAGAECSSGFCVDTVCCDQDCTGQCEACNQTGTPGLCVPVSGAPVGKPACGGTGPCAGSCSGTNPDACTFPTTACGDGKACSNGECVQTQAVCVDNDTASQSPSGAKTPCQPYRCDPATGTCRTSCSKAAECTLGNVCVGGQCTTGAGGVGGSDAGAGGATGGAGTGAGAVAPAAGDDGGCGCRTPRGAGRVPLEALGAGLGLLIALARRRRTGSAA